MGTCRRTELTIVSAGTDAESLVSNVVVGFFNRKNFPLTAWTLRVLASRANHWILGSIAVALVCAAALLQAYALHSQYRAEELLREVRTLRLGKSSAADVDRIRTKFHRYERLWGPCTPAACTYVIQWDDYQILRDHPRLTGLLLWKESDFGHSTYLYKALTRAGLHFYRAGASFTVSHGTLGDLGFSAAIEMPDGGTLIGDAVTHRFSPPYAESQAFERHPEYWVGSPGGCSGCTAIYAVFSPFASEKELQHAFDFNLSCISRFWTSCTEHRDIMPSAAADREKDAAYDAAHEDLPRTCTAATAYVFARGSDTVLLTAFRPTALRKSKEDRVFHLQLRSPKVLKQGERPQLTQLAIIVRENSWFAEPGTDRPSREILFSSNPLLVFLDRRYTAPDPNCGIMQATLENLAAVRFSIEREQEWKTRFGKDLPGK